jgi:hypothetical protein
LFFLNFSHFNFLHNLKNVVAVGFLTPHDSRNLTTVKFLESAPPQGGSYSPKAFLSLGYFFNANNPQGGSYSPKAFLSLGYFFNANNPQGGSYSPYALQNLY